MIKQGKGKQRVTSCAWTLPYFIISLFFGFLSLPFSFVVLLILPFCFPYFKKKKGRER